MPLLSVPAHLVGDQPKGGRTKRRVDIVVPVYGGLELTLACLESVLADLPRWARVVVVDDASPDLRLAEELGKLAKRKRITLLTQEVNRGFPGTANIGMRHDPARDVVLLNSDTLTPQVGLIVCATPPIWRLRLAVQRRCRTMRRLSATQAWSTRMQCPSWTRQSS
jgi:glycosyltransferase involved in cell wall biosynthesis